MTLAAPFPIGSSQGMAAPRRQFRTHHTTLHWLCGTQASMALANHLFAHDPKAEANCIMH